MFDLADFMILMSLEAQLHGFIFCLFDRNLFYLVWSPGSTADQICSAFTTVWGAVHS